MRRARALLLLLFGFVTADESDPDTDLDFGGVYPSFHAGEVTL